MNTQMNGKKVQRIEYTDGPSGNPSVWDQNAKRCAGQHMLLSATYHGDRDEFWLVTYNDAGRETERRRAQSVDRIVWAEDQA